MCGKNPKVLFRANLFYLAIIVTFIALAKGQKNLNIVSLRRQIYQSANPNFQIVVPSQAYEPPSRRSASVEDIINSDVDLTNIKISRPRSIVLDEIFNPPPKHFESSIPEEERAPKETSLAKNAKFKDMSSELNAVASGKNSRISNTSSKSGKQASAASNSFQTRTQKRENIQEATYENETPNYDFQYKVHGGRNIFGHEESRRDAKATGEYYVLLPDGRRQVVTYYADETGYHPRVRYEDSPMKITLVYDSANPEKTTGPGYRAKRQFRHGKRVVIKKRKLGPISRNHFRK